MSTTKCVLCRVVLLGRAFPVQGIVQQLLNVGLIGQTLPGRQVLRQRYIGHGQAEMARMRGLYIEARAQPGLFA